MMIPHEPWLVALSVAIAIQGSFVGLSLARGIDSAEGFRRRLAIAGSAITLARSEERRVGKECYALCRSRWSPYH